MQLGLETSESFLQILLDPVADVDVIAEVVVVDENVRGIVLGGVVRHVRAIKAVVAIA